MQAVSAITPFNSNPSGTNRWAGWPCALVLAMLVVAGLALSGVARAEPVAVSGQVDDGYGTITFGWQAPVPFTVSQQGRTVTIGFARPVTSANFAGALTTLSGYLDGAQIGDGGNSIVLNLKGDFEASGYDAGGRVNIFFVGDPVGAAAEPQQAEAPSEPEPQVEAEPQAAGPEQATTESAPAAEAPEQPAPPAQPAEPVAEIPLEGAPQIAEATPAATPTAAPVAPSGPDIRIRTGLHEDYTRVVFDFIEAVGYEFRNDDGVVRVEFESPAQFDLSRFNGNPPRLIGGARADYDGNGVTVTFAVPDTSEVRHFRSGEKLVLDVRNPNGVATPVALPAQPPFADTQLAAAPEPQPEAEPAAPQQAALPDEQPAEPVPETGPAPADAGADAAATEEGGFGEEASGGEAFSAEADPDAEPDAPVDPNAPISLTPPEAAEGVSGALGEFGRTPEALTNFQENVSRQAADREAREEAIDPRRAQAVALRFDWADPVGAAVFRRTGPLWVVFDKYIAVDTRALKEAAGNAIRSVEQIRSPRATILRFDTLKGINPNLKRDGLAWILEFRKQELFANQSIEVKAQPDSPVGPRIFIPIAEPGEPIVTIDPDVGDTIVVMPVIPLSHGVNHLFRYPDAQVLKTAQGVVVKPWTDDIRVRSLRQGVEITTPANLNVSKVAPEIAANMMLEVVKPLTRIFDLDEWRRGDISTYNENRSKLYIALARSEPGAARDDARLELARFYFANRFAPEALGVLRVAVQNNTEMALDPEVILMRGASNVLMGRYIEAAEFLADPVLDGNDESIFWRSLLVAETGELPLAAEELRRTGSIIRPYPRALKVPLGLIITEAAIELGDTKSANHYLEILNVESPTPSEQEAIAFVEGRLGEVEGDFETAISKWEGLTEGENRWVRARAAVAKIELLMKLQRMDEVEAVEEMEALRFAWRGDDFEFNLLRRLGDLYLTIGDYRNGLNTLRQAATHFREHDDAPVVTREMADAFQALYLENRADQLPPVTAIALYDEFKELTPAGARGDQMIQSLAERLVDADLLDRAAELLEGQVQFRLKGQEQARVGARLALIYVMARRFEDALDALGRTTVNGATDEVVNQRRLVEARAMMGLERDGEALTLLEQDESIDSYRLRNVIYWDTKDWRMSSQSLREILKLLDTRSGDELSDEQQQYVLRLAVAMTLAGNDRGVARLSKDHGAAMLGGPLAEAFQLIARGPERGLIDYRTIAQKVSSVQTFQTFLSSMKERMRAENERAFN